MEIAARFPQAPTAIIVVYGLKKTPRLRAGEESDDTQTAYRVAAFQTFLSGRISTFGDTGVAFVSPSEGIDATTPAGRLQLHVLGAIAEFERGRVV